MNRNGHNNPPTAIAELAFELKLAAGRSAKWDDEFEEFIARLPADFDRTSLLLTLAGCRRSTERLAELYRLVLELAPHEPLLRELAEGEPVIARVKE